MLHPFVLQTRGGARQTCQFLPERLVEDQGAEQLLCVLERVGDPRPKPWILQPARRVGLLRELPDGNREAWIPDAEVAAGTVQTLDQILYRVLGLGILRLIGIGRAGVCARLRLRWRVLPSDVGLLRVRWGG